MGDNKITVRALLTAGMVVLVAILTWTLAPLQSAATPYLSGPTADLTRSAPPELARATSGPIPEPLLSIDLAVAFAAGRPLVGLAVLDRQSGTYLDNGSSAHTAVGSASVIKVLLAEELLHRAGLGEVELGPSELARMETMLVDSNDGAASSLYRQFGGVDLITAALARHGLTESGPPANPQYWGNTMVTAHDVVIFYANLLAGSLAPPDQAYLLGLLRSIAPVATDGFDQVFGVNGVDSTSPAAVKQGWMCCLDGVRNVHSTAVLGHQDRYVVVILTQYSTWLDYSYGQDTATQVARLVVDELTL